MWRSIPPITWARPELFQLDKDGRPTGVAGGAAGWASRPPDSCGGNPLYDWKVHPGRWVQLVDPAAGRLL